jgi:ligand-binding sensor domain-containing protein
MIYWTGAIAKCNFISMENIMLVSTRKGLVIAEKKVNSWTILESHFDAIPVTFSYEDPRNGHWWVALDHGHWGIKLHKSEDKGKSWSKMTVPMYPENAEIKKGIKASTSFIWSINQGGLNYPDRMYIGTIPGGLFISNDYGESWKLCEGLWNHHSREKNWFGGGFDHPGIHSINIDPRNEETIQIGISCAGVFESSDSGQHWIAKNKGLIAEFLPDPNAEYGHDPHLLIRSNTNPDILWQQNHCGIFISENNGEQWNKVSQENGPAHFGFAIAVDEKNPLKAWVAPAVSDEHRIAVEKSLCISRTDDGGKTWRALRNGLPQNFAFDIVYRHAMQKSSDTLVFGTTTGNLYVSEDEGESWETLSQNLPMIHAISFGKG